MKHCVHCVSILYSVGQKNGTKFLYTNNFAKCEPIFNFFSLSESEENL